MKSFKQYSFKTLVYNKMLKKIISCIICCCFSISWVYILLKQRRKSSPQGYKLRKRSEITIQALKKYIPNKLEIASKSRRKCIKEVYIFWVHFEYIVLQLLVKFPKSHKFILIFNIKWRKRNFFNVKWPTGAKSICKFNLNVKLYW